MELPEIRQLRFQELIPNKKNKIPQMEALYNGKFPAKLGGKVKNDDMKKGDVLGVARVAGIMGVKRTSELIPMCHPLPIQKCSVDYELDETNGIIRAFCTVKTEGKTGVEMEALTGVQVTLLTIYDMCKAIDKHMVMSNIHLVEKTGGKSGDFHF